MRQRDWYLLAYDIRDPRRLRQAHYFLRKRGLAMQQSVFFLHVTEAELIEVLDRLAQLIERREDDVRAYPIPHPAEVWLTGQAATAGPLLRLPERPARPAATAAPRQSLRGLMRRLWSKTT